MASCVDKLLGRARTRSLVSVASSTMPNPRLNSDALVLLSELYLYLYTSVTEKLGVIERVTAE